MKQREWILSVDVGTSSVKATIFNGEVELVRESSSSYPLIQTQSGFVEQDPQKVLEAFHQANGHHSGARIYPEASGD